MSSSNQETHEVQVQRPGMHGYSVVDYRLTRVGAEKRAAELRSSQLYPVRINSPLSP